MLEISSRSQFRIGLCISMIIMLLGIASVFTIKTMDEINHRFNQNIEFDKIQTTFLDIEKKYQKQNLIFEEMISKKNTKNVGSFWIYNAEIKNSLASFNQFLTNDLRTGQILSENEYSELNRDFLAYYEMHLTYENYASNAINHYYENNHSGFLQEYDNMKFFQSGLINQMDEINKTLDTFPTSSKFLMINMIDGFQNLQFLMIFLIGVITTILVFLLNQTNRNLKDEIQDKTKSLQRLNKKLLKMDDKRKEYISVASHELKGPIQPIFGFVELAQSGLISKQEAIDGISSIAYHLENIANNVLDLTKIENNELDINLDKHDINEIVREVVHSEQFNPERKVPISLRLDSKIILNIDKTRIKQVFRNILDNCIKYTESGEIKVQTHLMKDEKNLKIYFSDTGPEIPKDILQRIFEKFVTKKNSGVSGFGLGLYISKKIVNSHGGEILAYNQNGHPVFEITLPLVGIGLDQSQDFENFKSKIDMKSKSINPIISSNYDNGQKING